MEKILYIGIFLAFAVKSPIIPLHTWLPDTHGEEQSTGRKIPIIQVTWIQPDDVTVESIYLEWWQTSAPERKAHLTLPKTTTSTAITGLVPKAEYTIRATVVASPPRETLWGPGITVITLSEEIYIDPDQIADTVGDLNRWDNININIAWMRNELNCLNAVVSDQTASDYLDRQFIRQELVEQAEGIRAEYKERITIVVSETQQSPNWKRYLA